MVTPMFGIPSPFPALTRAARRGLLALLTAALVALTMLATAPMARADVALSGTVYNDVNGLEDATINGTGVGALGAYGQLYVTAISSGVVIATTDVAADGTYSLTVPDGSYTLLLSRYDEATLVGVGNAPGFGAAIPADWQYTAEGISSSGDGTPDGSVALANAAGSAFTVNFGVRELDTDRDGIPNSQNLVAACWDTNYAGDGAPHPPTGTYIAHGATTGYGPTPGTSNYFRVGTNAAAITSLGAGAGLTLGRNTGPQSFAISGVEATTAADAKASNEYVEYSFTTDNGFSTAYIDWVGFLNRIQQEEFDVLVAISESGGPFFDLATFHEALNDGNTTAGRENEDIADYAVGPSTTYTVRYYFYNVEAPASAPLDFDDPFVAFDVCPYVGLSGSVLNDADGATDGIVDGTGIGTPEGQPLYATLVNQAGIVVATVAVDGAGNYNFGTTLVPGNYDVQIGTTNTSGMTGQAAPTPALPTGWENTGESAGSGLDGTADGSTPVALTQPTTSGVLFGIQRPPTAHDVSAPEQLNPGGSTTVEVPQLDPRDAEDGVPTTIVIETLPTGGTLYYDGVAVTAGQVITSYDPALLTVDPNDGPVTVEFTYSTIDAAGAQSEAAEVAMPFATAEIEVIKSVSSISDENGNALADIGERVNYTFQVTNTGTTDLTQVQVSDGNAVVVGGPISLAAGQVDATSFTASHVLTEADIEAGGVENTATVSGFSGTTEVSDISDAGTDPSGAEVTDPGSVATDNPLGVNGSTSDTDDDPTTALFDVVPALELIKSIDDVVDANGNGRVDAGDVISYTFTVTNVGNVALDDITVTDPKVVVVGGPVSLAAGASDDTTFTASYTITEADVSAGGVENVAVATGSHGTDRVTDTSDAGTDAEGNEIDNPGGTETDNPLGEYENTDDPGDDPTTLIFEKDLMALTGVNGVVALTLVALVLLGVGGAVLIVGRRQAR